MRFQNLDAHLDACATIFAVSYIPLRVQSHWSLLDGVPSVPELVAHAASLELPALALTDRNALYGAVEFVAGCRAAGIRPIIGAGLNLAAGLSPSAGERNASGVAHHRAEGLNPSANERNASNSLHTLVLLAQNPTGYGNLCRLISLMQASPQLRPPGSEENPVGPERGQVRAH